MNLSKFLPFRTPFSGIQYFDEIFGNFNDAIILLSLTGEILKCNQPTCEIFNLSSAQLIKHDYFEICRQYNINPPFISLKQMAENAKPTITVMNHLPSVKTVQWKAFPIKHNAQIESICLQGADITAFYSNSVMATSLQNSIIDNLPNYFIFWKDRNSVFLGCNKAFALSANLNSPADIIGKTDYDLPWPKEESDRYIADDRQVMESQIAKLNIEEPRIFAK